MERPEPTSTNVLGARIKRGSDRALLGGRLQFTEWMLDPSGDDFTAALGQLVASAYVSAEMRWEFPHASVADLLPAPGTTPRKGDFGELIAGALYSTQMGQTVPFQRLEGKSTKGATLQGADLLALSLQHGETPEPTIVEVKYRSLANASHLDDLESSLAVATDDYLVSAWVSGARLMRQHPDRQRSFALAAAQSLAKLIDPDEPTPEHLRHAVILTGRSSIAPPAIENKWGMAPPVSHLHVVVIDNLADTMDKAYAYAEKLTYADVSSGVPAMLESKKRRPGLAAAVSSFEARDLLSTGPTGWLALQEAALWLLADWDGMGDARARRLALRGESAEVRGLARLLSGDVRGAIDELTAYPDLLDLVSMTAQAWELSLSQAEYRAAIAPLAGRMPDQLSLATLQLIGAAISYRLDRHPAALTASAQSTGPNVGHVVGQMRRKHIRALWPSQAKALSSGLLDPACPSLAIKMPTSAGKTALMELVIADALDREPDAAVAVLAPKKALVSQLTRGFRDVLPAEIEVRSSHGGLDFDIEDPGADGILKGRGVAVLTPERFDLEWRRSATGDTNADTSNLKLLIVDEAHLLMERKRGDRLELVIGRALSRGIRVVLLSSQLPDTEAIAHWIDGGEVESDWTPTWLRRSVYFQSADKKAGLLQDEVGDAVHCLDLDPKAAATTPATCRPKRPDEAVEIAASLADEGLVILYSDVKRWIPSVVDAARARLPAVHPIDPDLDALALLISAAEPEYASLLEAGIGVHHADVPRRVRQAVEDAARRNLLRLIICTSTLMEGVDFPARTVIATYPPRTRPPYLQPDLARLRNLAGRAGRGGRFTYGSLIVMNFKEADALKWLSAFRRQLPNTTSTLTQALTWVAKYAASPEMSLVGQGERSEIASLDALILAAIAEGAVVDGDLRASLEAVLGRTLWATGAEATQRDYLLDRAVERSGRVRARIGGDVWSTAFYRVGLPLASSLALREAIKPYAAALAEAAESIASDADAWLLWMASEVAPRAPELATWAALPTDALKATLGLWLAGTPDDAIATAFPEVWPVVEGNDLESLLPWILTGVVEFAAAEVGRPDLRDTAHQRFEPVRLRYGVPHQDLCEYVQAGLDRSAVTQYRHDYTTLAATGQVWTSYEEYMNERAVADADRLLEEAKAARAARSQVQDPPTPEVVSEPF